MKMILRAVVVAALTLTTTETYAQKWLKKTRKAQVSVVTVDAAGNIHETQGVTLGGGTVITDYDALKGAVKITVIDSEGKEYPVTEIAGADAMYNVAKLLCDKDDKPCVTLAAASSAAEETVYVMPSVKADKKATCLTDTVSKVDTFKEKYHYYTLTRTVGDRLGSAALMNGEGELIGLLQMSSGDAAHAFAIDASYAAGLHIGALDGGNLDLSSIRIRKSLPESEDEALTFIYLTGQKDTVFYDGYVDAFIGKFPTNTTGYILKAEAEVGKNNLQGAAETYDKILSDSKLKHDEAHYSLSKTIYTLAQSPSYTPYADWTLEKALSEAQEAYKVNPLPLYIHQEANCLYSLKRYNEAAEKFVSLSQTNMRSSETFLYAVQCKQAAGANADEVVALLDSALSCYPKPYPAAAAPVVMMRAKALAEAGKAKEAVLGYNNYEHLCAGNVSANFHYEREQLEVKCRMYPAALSDIEKAIKLAPDDALLYAEAASLNYRLGDVATSESYARKAIEKDGNFSDAYRILGVCLMQSGKEKEAKETLTKAKELGDTLAEGLLEKYASQ